MAQLEARKNMLEAQLVQGDDVKARREARSETMRREFSRPPVAPTTT
jgi:hypothetical protein